jgi:hypothetical protein
MKSTPETQERAMAVYDFISANPDAHNQKNYFDNPEGHCGTTMCIAGTALFLEYGHKSLGDFDVYRNSNHPDSSIDDIAGELLGLNMHEAMSLFFDMDNDSAMRRLKFIVAGDEFAFAESMERVNEDD